ncbi:hypothetical protein FVE85_7836 [Porphyridium purpureum]|uniref:Uncharacterized protein n=1 Tax=Porphyridium purpureum TaxID=35688 RepID=A0A5J4YHH0_PORPP|nr:hypothetical protein FVE85_7836 [Porphyridium purpureum]|eukprot:POR3620..scf271_22
MLLPSGAHLLTQGCTNSSMRNIKASAEEANADKAGQSDMLDMIVAELNTPAQLPVREACMAEKDVRTRRRTLTEFAFGQCYEM